MYKIMIADDEPIVRKGLVKLVDWESINCEIVFQAEDGIQVIENLDSYKPDILICDIKMPRIDGIGVAKYIYDNHISTKVIILTGYADFSYAKSAIKYNVIDYITKANALEGIADAVKKAQNALESTQRTHYFKDINSLRINFLKSIMDTSLYECDVETGVSNYSIVLNQYAVISLQFLPNEKLNTTESGKFLKSITNFFNMSFVCYHTYLIPLSKVHFCIIVYDIENDSQVDLKKVSIDLANTLESFMKLYVVIGISEIYDDINNLQPACQQATIYSNQYFLDHSQKVYCAVDSTETRPFDMKPLSLLIDNITVEVQKGDATAAICCLHDFLGNQSDTGMDMIKSMGIILVNTCDKLLLSSSVDINVQTLTSNPHVVSDILNCTLLEQFKNTIEQVLSVTSLYLGEKNQNKNKLVVDALEYIEKNYYKNITLMDIANALYINSSYLSRIFKEHTGNTIISTINMKKIEKAKDLLAQGDSKIYEISDAVGIQDTTYFSHFFKKHTGLSPKDFKEKS